MTGMQVFQINGTNCRALDNSLTHMSALYKFCAVEQVNSPRYQLEHCNKFVNVLLDNRDEPSSLSSSQMKVKTNPDFRKQWY